MIEPTSIIVVGLACVGGLVGYGRLQTRVDRAEKTVDGKVDRCEFEQFERRLERIETGVDAIQSHLMKP